MADEENKTFKKWLRKQKLNTLAELYVRHLYFNVGGWDAVRKWQSAQQGDSLDNCPIHDLKLIDGHCPSLTCRYSE